MVGWFFILALVCVAIVALYSVFLPKFFLRTRYKIAEPSGRGLKIVLDEKGKNILYEPDGKIAPYVKQYILSEKDGKKSLICKLDHGIRYIDYDVVLFNGKNKAFKGLRVKEFVGETEYTRVVELPEETCYVSLLLNEADGIRINNGKSRRICKSWLVAFIALCVIVEALGFWALRVCIAYAFGGLFTESFLVSLSDIYEFIVFCVIAVILNLLFLWIGVKTKAGK